MTEMEMSFDTFKEDFCMLLLTQNLVGKYTKLLGANTFEKIYYMIKDILPQFTGYVDMADRFVE
jgi:hypothetical protein